MPEIGNAWRQFAPSPLALKPGKEWNVFLSYRSVNRPWVINLYDVLRTFGHTVFLDQVAMAAGDRLTKSLERALEKSQAGVLVWSSAAADSDWVHDEYAVMKAQADEGDFHFVPVRLDATKLPSFAATRIFLDFSQYPDGPNGGELLRLLHAVVGKPLSEDAARFASQQDEVAARDTARVKAAVKNGAAAEIQRLFDDGGDPWHTSAALGCLAAEGLTKLKEYDRALSMLQALEDRFPRAIRPKQLRALALARRAQANDLEQAQAILGELYELKQRDPETLGIYGRTWMDRYNQSKNMLHLRMSREMYAEAFEGAQDDYYTGINAAAKSILLSTPADVAKGRSLRSGSGRLSAMRRCGATTGRRPLLARCS
ncbi:MAG: toll/interleukin-1 receptor domain-containing protein [Gemmatimonadaceae bacterium]